MIPSYRPTELLRETLKSVAAALANVSSPWELTIVDDASPNVDVQTLVNSWGFTSVKVYQRERNGGLAACWNTCIDRAQGEWIHLLHQDDLVEHEFYSKMGALCGRFPDAGMAFCRVQFLKNGERSEDQIVQSSEGILDNWLDRICERQRLQCPSVVVRKSTYRTIGGFDDKLLYTIDWEMWIRIAISFSVAYTPEILATYRIHDSSETTRLKRSGVISKDAKETYRCIARLLSGHANFARRQLVKSYLLQNAQSAVALAQKNGEYKTARRELLGLIKNWWNSMPPIQVLQNLKWYWNLLLLSEKN